MSERPIPEHIVFDWGDTLMPVDSAQNVPMYLWPQVRVFPEIIPTLDLLKGRFKLSIATNAEQSNEDMIRKALARVGLDAYFQEIFCFTRVGFWKSEPLFWEHVLKVLGTEPSKVWMVGDSFFDDILSASACGIFSIWINRRTEETRSGKTFATVHSLADLPGLLARKEIST